MKIIKWTILLMILIGIVSCQEEKKTPEGDGAVVFKGMQVNKGEKSTLKNETYEKADYALVTIDGTDHILEVFYLEGRPYTQSLKLAPGSHTVSRFLMKSDNNTPDDTSDDAELLAMPETGSEYAEYVTTTVDFDFEINAFLKTEVNVEVLTFIESEWEAFGFNWFGVSESVIREQSFFGDLCVKKPEEYSGSLYAQQTNGLQIDMPAIYQLELWQKSEAEADQGYELMETFDNESSLGEEPLQIDYEDYLGFLDEYKVVLKILVRSGEGFEYKMFKEWYFEDENMIADPSQDGVIDFVLGSCFPNADYILPPYMNLPETCTYRITDYGPGTEGAYIDAQLSGIGTGYEIGNGLYPSWCFDHEVEINVNTDYPMDIYSSLYPDQMPGFAQQEQWDRANWLMNHLDWYGDYTWNDLQGALWLIEGWNGDDTGDVGPATVKAQQMANDAADYGDGYVPMPGGWAAVVFIHPNSPENNPLYQTVFIVVDP